MKNSHFVGSCLAAFFVLAFPSGCSSVPKQDLDASTLNPAGKGTVEVRADRNNNTQLNVEVDHLPPPERMASDAGTYVVWIAPAGSPDRARSLGALKVDEGLNGRLQAVTPLQSFDLFITAERDATVPKPSGERLLWTQVSRG